MKESDATSYGQIAKSTSLFAGTQLINILAGIVRTKVLALLLGTAGIGLVGLYLSVVEFVKSIAGMGLSFSAVKDIAQAKSTGDEVKMGVIFTVTRRLVWGTSVLGLLIMLVFSKFISLWVFNDTEHVWPICLLSFCVLTGLLSSGQMVLLQGTRQLRDMAKASVYGTLLGLVVAIALYAWLGQEGIVPALICLSLISLFFSWFFTRRLRAMKAALSLNETWSKGRAMIRLGFMAMLSGLASTLGMMLMKSFILKTSDMNDVGLFQAVWSLSSLYIGAILSAMSTDYYPKLCSLEHDNDAMMHFANQQIRFVLLVSTPLVVLVLVFSSLILTVFYSTSFLAATSLMQWQILGTFFKVLIWPVAFFLLAKGKGVRFLLTEVSWYVVYYVATRLLWPLFGLEAAGVAFVLAYIVYCPLVVGMVNPLCRIRVTAANLKLMILYTLATVGTFVAMYYLSGTIKWLAAVGLCLTVISYSLIELNRILPFNRLLEKIRPWIKR